MLKALELYGFKSFADKTRFEFPDGITVIVGPNGSGKSNLVDAIKWVLGSQSAKSLRGKDMVDVIFKGTNSRKAINTAEATIIFDNSAGQFAVDAPEVHVTRRVYRSGEGEYLINRQPCRLKDVRDLFRGTGAGSDAYSLIEQGKVDRLLQATPRDRRAIFEEAAGISRFKAKKIEAQRRLERVEQNLLRLSDIVDEVESRLRSVRAQAGKARRYREYSDRLQQLRTQVAMTDWHKLSSKLATARQQSQHFRDQSDELVAQCTAADARGLEIEAEIVAIAAAIHDREQRLARTHEEIGTRQSRVELEHARVAELHEEAARYRAQTAALSGRIGDLSERLENTRTELQSAESCLAAVRQQLAEHDDAVARLAAQVASWQAELAECTDRHVAAMRAMADLTNRIGGLESESAAATSELTQCGESLVHLANEEETLSAALAAALATEQQLVGQLGQTDTQLEVSERELADEQRLLVRRRDELAVQQGRLGGLEQRASLLEELEQRREGLTAGVKQVLALAQRERPGAFAGVVGLVADIVQASTEWAAVIDAALGRRSQYIVLRDREVLNDLVTGRFRPNGRVGFISLPQVTADTDRLPAALQRQAGVLGRLDEYVECRAEFGPLVRQLLGDTWAVAALADAFLLREAGVRGVRFVTRAGEVVQPDGIVTAGPKDVAALISRRSELRDLHREQAVLISRIAEATNELKRLQENIDQHQIRLHRLKDDRQGVADALSDTRVQLAATRRHGSEIQQRRTERRKQQDTARQRLAQARQQIESVQAQVVQTQGVIDAMATSIDSGRQQIDDAERRWREHQQAATAKHVDRARWEQRLDAFRSELRRFEEDQRERDQAMAESRTQLDHIARRVQTTERAILTATAELAHLYLRKEELVRDVAADSRRHEALQADRNLAMQRLRQLRSDVDAVQSQLHQHDLIGSQLESERTALADRLRDDYGIEISDFGDGAGGEASSERETVEQEINLLRRRISNIGAVNMEALGELDELETRYASLSGQYRDLTDAKEALQRIINKINADSRRLFTETLDAIRINFGALYRRAFGGGKADIVLEEGVDVLEAGIEIMATPPGKPSFSNSLLSGGERALTAVALLLAIFQYRPSPFCVLDEVDAPFDEANIERFVDVLKDFLQWTKFVLVTHSKKTMTAATTLYGVTMQESGVSKQVAVRFEDVSDDGQILDEAVARAAEAEPDRASETATDDERGAA